MSFGIYPIAPLQLKKEYKNGTRNKNEIVKKARKVCKEKYGDGGYIGSIRNNPEFEKKIRKSINDKYGSTFNMLKKSAFSALGKINYSGSKLEQAMENFLKKKNKEYIKQFHVGRRRIDFYIPKEKLFIEVSFRPTR